MSNGSDNSDKKLPSFWPKVTNVSTIVAVVTGLALSGTLQYGDHAIAWDLPDVIEPYVTALFVLATSLAGGGKAKVKQLKKKLGLNK